MPRFGFTVHHNGPPANCVGQPHSRCERFFAAVGRYHASKWGDQWLRSVYSFGVCPHGIRFVGQGWDKRQAANGSDQVGENDGRDSDWYTVLVFLGGDEKPTEAMINGVRELINEGRKAGLCGLRVLPHNAFKRKVCPGPEFTALAKQWDNKPFDQPAPEPEDEEEMKFNPDQAHWTVTMAYKNIVGRDPKPDDSAYWESKLIDDGQNVFALLFGLLNEFRVNNKA